MNVKECVILLIMIAFVYLEMVGEVELWHFVSPTWLSIVDAIEEFTYMSAVIEGLSINVDIDSLA